MFRRKGQSTLEYAIIIAVVVGALIAMQHYVKRGYQGRLKSASDEMGEQFDPASYSANFNITQTSKVVQNVSTGESETSYLNPAIANKTGTENLTGWTNTTSLFE